MPRLLPIALLGGLLLLATACAADTRSTPGSEPTETTATPRFTTPPVSGADVESALASLQKEFVAAYRAEAAGKVGQIVAMVIPDNFDGKCKTAGTSHLGLTSNLDGDVKQSPSLEKKILAYLAADGWVLRPGQRSNGDGTNTKFTKETSKGFSVYVYGDDGDDIGIGVQLVGETPCLPGKFGPLANVSPEPLTPPGS